MSGPTNRPAPVVIPGGHGLVVPAELLSELLAALRLLLDLQAGRVPPAACRRPPSAALLVLLDACQRAAVDHQAARHALAAALGNPTPAVVAPPQTARRLTGTEVTTREAADMTGLSTERWRQLAASGAVPARRVAGSWLLDRDAVLTYSTERQQAA